MRGIKTSLTPPFKRHMVGNQRPILKDADGIGQDMNIENAPTRRVGNRVKIAPDADHALMREPALELEQCLIRG